MDLGLWYQLGHRLEYRLEHGLEYGLRLSCLAEVCCHALVLELNR